MRSATEREADVVLAMLPHFVRSRFGSSLAGAILARIERMFSGETDRSLYGLMNAVTAVAREEREPRTRWRLEELGGGIPALLLPPRPVIDTLTPASSPPLSRKSRPWKRKVSRS